ncbi:MAG: hypothetical protein U0587_16200 [Candidatus Binatia bacterium]
MASVVAAGAGNRGRNRGVHRAAGVAGTGIKLNIPPGRENLTPTLVLQYSSSTVRHYRRHFFAMVGHVHPIALYCARTDLDKAKGSGWARLVFHRAA